MALADLSFQAAVTVGLQARIAPPGNAAGNTLPSPVVKPGATGRQQLAFGTAAGKADIVATRQDTLAAGATATYDLYTGTDIPDPFGGTAALRKLKAVAVVINSGGDSAGVIVGGAASNAHPLMFTDSSGAALATACQKIKPDGAPFVQTDSAGVTVDATHKNLKLKNLGAVAVTVTVIVCGTSV